MVSTEPIEYYLTDKGLALQPILDIMAAYSMKYCSKDVFKDAQPRQFEQLYSMDIAEVQVGKVFS